MSRKILIAIFGFSIAFCLIHFGKALNLPHNELNWRINSQQNQYSFFRARHILKCDNSHKKCAEIEVTIEPLKKWAEEFGSTTTDNEKLQRATDIMIGLLKSLGHKDIVSTPLQVPSRNLRTISSLLEKESVRATTVIEVNSQCVVTYMLVTPKFNQEKIKDRFNSVWRNTLLTSDCKAKLASLD